MSATISEAQSAIKGRESQRLQRTVFHVGREEQRQEDEHRDDGGKHVEPRISLLATYTTSRTGPRSVSGFVAFCRSRQQNVLDIDHRVVDEPADCDR